jgi:hypothetical protein
MDKNQHTDLLVLQLIELTERTPFCPDDRTVAEYYDGVMSEEDLSPFERHLADCRFCQARIGMLNRQQNESLDGRVPGEVLANAKTLVRPTRSQRIRKYPAWAMAAMVILGVFFVVRDQPVTEPEVVQLRSIERAGSRLEVSMSGPGNRIDTASTIRWTALPGETHYKIYVLSDEGDVLWTEHLLNNEWVLKESLQLNSDQDYFFRVEAELEDGGTISSPHLAFRVKDP